MSLLNISRKTALGREIVEKADRIYVDRGGKENCSELHQDLVSRYTITELLIQSVDSWLLTQPSLINKSKRSLLPIIAERNKLVRPR